MKRAFGVVCITSIIYLAAFLIGFYIYELNAENELEQLLLSYVIDFSADGAMSESLDMQQDIGPDYSDNNKIYLDPKQILDSFIDMFCINYDLGRSIETKKYVTQNFIPAVCVADYDGYYIARLQPVKSDIDTLYPSTDKLKNSSWDLIFGPKMPYIYKYKENGISKCCALNMGMNYIYTSKGVKKDDISTTGLKSKQAGMIEINKILIKELADTINFSNKTGKYTFSLPLQLSSYSGINPIMGPSLIIMAQNVDLRTSKPISGFSISGTRMERARFVVGYIRNGIKYYCYADCAPDSSKIDGDGQYTDLFSSISDAAQAGYNCDLKYIK